MHPKYELGPLLGEGGMGAVYSATEVALGRLVAVKVLAPALARDDHFRGRFEREARAAAAISHPNVVRVYTVGETAGDPPLPYIIMQHVDGTPLHELLRGQGRLPERRARRLLRDVAVALAAAHERDLVHRDIKPANILIETGTGRAHVADFGISAALSPRAIGGAQPLAEDGRIIGTPPYMSPEQAVGDVIGPRSDVYSLGVLAYEVLSGSLPFEADSPEAWRAAHLTAEPPPLRERRKGISDDLARLIDRCLAKEPALRPGAADLARELVPSAEDEILWPPPGLVELPRLGRRLRRAAGLVVGATVLLLGALALPLPGVHSAAGWWGAWAGGSVTSTAAAGPPGSVVLWQAAVLLGAVGLAGGLAMHAVLLARSLATVRRLGALGWREVTIRDALADPDGRTGLLLAGSGEFAARTAVDRDRLRRFRWLTHAALLASAGWLCAALASWSVTVLAGAPVQPAGGPPVGPAQALVVGLPLLIGLTLSGVALVQEWRATGRSWRRPHTGTFAVPSDAGVEEITAWYAELPGNSSPAVPRQPPSIPRLRFLGLGVAVLTGWTVVAVGLLVISTLLAGRLVRRLGSETARVAAFVDMQHGPSPLADSRVALRPYLPAREHSPSSDTLLRALLAEAPRGLPPYPVDPRLVLGSQPGGLAPRTLVGDAIGRAAELSADTLGMLAVLADHPRTHRLRALARMPGVTLPLESDSSIRIAMEANAAGAVLATARGQLTDAAARLGENAAIAELAIAAPGRHWPEVGLRMLRDVVLLPLAEVERLRANHEVAAELRRVAVSVEETIQRIGGSSHSGAIGLGSDPRDLRVLQRLLADSTVPPGLRAAAIEASGDAVCLNPREWLAGAHPARRTELGGIPAVPEMFQSRGIGKVVERIRYCATLAGR